MNNHIQNSSMKTRGGKSNQTTVNQILNDNNIKLEDYITVTQSVKLNTDMKMS